MSDLVQLAAAYHEAIMQLDSAERKHRQLHPCQAPALGKPSTSAETAETTQAIRKALHAATCAHRQYWNARRAQLLPQMLQAALLIARYNRIAYAAGDLTGYPALALLEDLWPKTQAVDVEQDVPAEGPDSDLSEGFRGQ